jgi:hypothetical protein
MTFVCINWIFTLIRRTSNKKQKKISVLSTKNKLGVESIFRLARLLPYIPIGVRQCAQQKRSYNAILFIQLSGLRPISSRLNGSFLGISCHWSDLVADRFYTCQ